MSTQETVPPNPYESMEANVFKNHVSWLASVVKSKLPDVDLYDAFGLEKGETISEEDKKKIERHDKFSAMAQQIFEDKPVEVSQVEAKKTVIDPNLERIAQKTVDSLVSDMKSVDSDIPIDDIVNGSGSVFEKLDMLEKMQKVVDYHGRTVKGLRENLDGNRRDDKFSAGKRSGGNWDNFIENQQSYVNKALGIGEE